uniref:Trichome birefringence-like C-terminal domain-containing protein n=1 Tax=Arundo donax TaxID=35708 RepID=A0A0A9SG23_ARUDO
MPEINVMLEQVSKRMKTPVTILNITNLSGLRIDGHPSVYGRKALGLTAPRVQDCSHWCLPGVPDTWNELLFYYVVSSEGKDVTR